MPNTCVVQNCKNRAVPGCSVSFHRIPQQEEPRAKWLAAIQRDYWTPSRTTVLCSKHFRPECFEERNGRRFLRIGSVPSIFPIFSQGNSRKTKLGLPSRKEKKSPAKNPGREDLAKAPLPQNQIQTRPRRSPRKIFRESSTEVEEDIDGDLEPSGGSPKKNLQADDSAVEKSGDDMVKCPLCCGEHLVAARSLRSHLQWVLAHLRCPICRQSFSRLNGLLAHMEQHLPPRPLDDSPRKEQPSLVKKRGRGRPRKVSLSQDEETAAKRTRANEGAGVQEPSIIVPHHAEVELLTSSGSQGGIAATEEQTKEGGRTQETEDVEVFTFFLTTPCAGEDEVQDADVGQSTICIRDSGVAWCIVNDPEVERSRLQEGADVEEIPPRHLEEEEDDDDDDSVDVDYSECVACEACGEEFLNLDDLRKHHVLSEQCLLGTNETRT